MRLADARRPRQRSPIPRIVEASYSRARRRQAEPSRKRPPAAPGCRRGAGQARRPQPQTSTRSTATASPACWTSPGFAATSWTSPWTKRSEREQQDPTAGTGGCRCVAPGRSVQSSAMGLPLPQPGGIAAPVPRDHARAIRRKVYRTGHAPVIVQCQGLQLRLRVPDPRWGPVREPRGRPTRRSVHAPMPPEQWRMP